MNSLPEVTRRFHACTAFLCLVFAIPCSPFAQSSSHRPFNLFNVRNLRVSYLISSARALAMGGAAIAAPGEPTAINVNPASLAQFQFPAASLGHRFRKIDHSEPGTSCAHGNAAQEKGDLVNDQTMVNVIIPTRFVKIAVFREVVIDERLSTVSPQVLQGSPETMPDIEILQRNFPTRQTQLKFDVVDNAFAIAFRLSNSLHFGATFRLTGFEYRLNEQEYFASNLSGETEHLCTDNSLQADNLYLIRSVDESKWRPGMSAGLLLKISNRLTSGFTLLRRPAFDLATDILAPAYSLTVDTNGTAIAFPALRENAKITFDLPDVYGFGFSYRDFKRLTVGIDVSYVRYTEMLHALSDGGDRRTENLIQDDSFATAADPDGIADLTISDGWQFSAGIEYGITPKSRKLPFLQYKIQSLHLRAGYLRQPGGVLYANQANPSFRRFFPRQKSTNFFTVGLGTLVEVQSSRVRVDVAFSYSAESIEAMVSGAIFVF